MKKTVYLENIEAGIKRQMKWSNFHTETERNYFLDHIITICKILKTKPLKPPKSSKTRHG